MTIKKNWQKAHGHLQFEWVFRFAFVPFLFSLMAEITNEMGKHAENAH